MNFTKQYFKIIVIIIILVIVVKNKIIVRIKSCQQEFLLEERNKCASKAD